MGASTSQFFFFFSLFITTNLVFFFHYFQMLFYLRATPSLQPSILIWVARCFFHVWFLGLMFKTIFQNVSGLRQEMKLIPFLFWDEK